MPMGDATPAPGSATEFLVAAATASAFLPEEEKGQQAASLQPDLAPSLVAQLQQHQQPGNYQQTQQQHAFTPRFDMTTQTHGPGRGQPGPYNMSSMMQSLPHASFQPGQQRFSPPTPGGGAQTMPQISYAGPPTMTSMHGPQYYLSQHAPMHHYYGLGMPAPPQQQQQHQQPPRQHQQQQQHRQDGRSNPVYYQHQHVQPHYYYHPGGQFANHTPMMQNPLAVGQYVPAAPPNGDPRLAQQQIGDQSGGGNFQQPPVQLDGAKGDSRSSVVRGPPRKPKQSGHAIWIGNLPPQTELMGLVYHVCKEAPGLESLFLISKSNCAFANFKDEKACVVAQQKIHDSKFQSVRLVSRLRKSTVEGASGVTAPTGPSASTPQSAASRDTGVDGTSTVPVATAPSEAPIMDGGVAPPPVASPEAAAPTTVATSAPSPQKNKYFILKSLTVDDLEQSVKTGIWATQSHNEKTLNNAFQTSENVFLIFSANKSGEYFGYARMTSKINEDPAAAIEFAPKVQSVTDVGLPKAIPTEANEFMPRGSIMDDSERGTIFWEAEADEDAEEEESVVDDSGSAKSAGGEPGETKAWGKPFHLEWLSTARLPFYRTRGLRNPWNSNKEIKIARDGTELEPSVGRKLTGLFSVRGQSPVINVAGPGMRQQQMPVASGYPPMRPAY